MHGVTSEWTRMKIQEGDRVRRALLHPHWRRDTVWVEAVTGKIKLCPSLISVREYGPGRLSGPCVQ